MVSRILLTGSSSLVGSSFVEKFGNKYELCAIGRHDIFRGTGLLQVFDRVDITNADALKEAINRHDCQALVNFAASTNVDACEAERGDCDGLVFRTNSLAVRWMAKACKEHGIVLYQISTDAVFDGANGPYAEDDLAGSIDGKLSWYGHTKYLGEVALTEVRPEYCLVRISHPYRARFDSKLDFARRILSLYKRGRLFPLFTDQVFTPTLVDDVSSALDFLMEHRLRGTYHVASPIDTTPFEFGRELLDVFFPQDERVGKLAKGSVRAFNRTIGHAPRPIRGGLLTAKIEASGFRPRTFEEGIREIYRQSRRKNNHSRS